MSFALLKMTYQGEKVNHLVKHILGLATLLLITSGCYQMESPDLGGTASIGGNQGGEVGDDNPQNPESDYLFLGTTNMRYILRQELGLPGSNTAVQKLNDKAESLGEGDPNAGRPNDYSFSALKGKIATEVYIDACVDGLAQEVVRDRLFPNGATDPSEIYQRFIGRQPDPEEVNMLNQLVGAVSTNSQEAAVCATVLSSLEGLNKS